MSRGQGPVATLDLFKQSYYIAKYIYKLLFFSDERIVDISQFYRHSSKTETLITWETLIYKWSGGVVIGRLVRQSGGDHSEPITVS